MFHNYNLSKTFHCINSKGLYSPQPLMRLSCNWMNPEKQNRVFSKVPYQKNGEMNASVNLAQSVERKTLNLVVVGSSPTVGGSIFLPLFFLFMQTNQFFFKIVSSSLTK